MQKLYSMLAGCLLVSVVMFEAGCGGGDTIVGAECGDGTFEMGGDAGLRCRACGPGESIVTQGTGTADRTCVACPANTYSTTINAAECSAHVACEAGTYVSSPGTLTSNTVCSACPTGTFAATANASACEAWTTCQFDEIESVPGTTTGDRSCVDRGWTRRVGTSSIDHATAVATAGDSFIVVGLTHGDIAGNGSGGGAEPEWFARKIDAEGTSVWTTQLGRTATQQNGAAVHVAIAEDGSIYVVGVITSTGFVTKLDSDGLEEWTRTFDGVAFAVAVATDGSVYVAGDTGADLGGNGNAGGRDGFLRKYDSSGDVLWTSQQGTTATDRFAAVVVDDQQRVFVAGTSYESLNGQPRLGQVDAVLLRYTAAGAVVWTRQFGAGTSTEALSVAANGSAIFVSGYTSGSLEPNVTPGSTSAFVRSYDAEGAVGWTRQLPAGDDANNSQHRGKRLASLADGSLVLAGVTNVDLVDGSMRAQPEAFVATYSTSGVLQTTAQFGSTVYVDGYGIAATAAGRVVLVGVVGSGLLGGTSHLGGTLDGFAMLLPDYWN